MNELNYLVYERGGLIGGFVSLCTTETFMEGYRFDSPIEMDMVDAHTGEVINTWVNGHWVNGDY